ncbi:MAG: HAD hydrolase family protein [Planctomycetota bacterium]
MFHDLRSGNYGLGGVLASSPVLTLGGPGRILRYSVWTVAMEFDALSLLVLDVDGVLTDGAVVMSDTGGLIKAFHVRDGYAVQLWQRVGHQAALLSGRESPAVERRAAELGIEVVHQGCRDKLAAYERLLAAVGRSDAAVCYVGDDVPDLPPMRRCAFPVAVANAAPCVKQVAQYVTRLPGGAGAVAEVIELVLRKQQRWGGEERTASSGPRARTLHPRLWLKADR